MSKSGFQELLIQELHGGPSFGIFWNLTTKPKEPKSTKEVREVQALAKSFLNWPTLNHSAQLKIGQVLSIFGAKCW